jgi:excinuclease ABC subunit A
MRGLACGSCGTRFEEPTPALFSFNSPRGACPACQGFGRLVGIDELKVIPDPTKTIEEGPIAPFNVPSYESAYDDLKRACRKYGVRRNVPWKDLTAKERGIVWDGEGAWYGVTGLFKHLEKKRYKMHVRIFLARYRGYPTCSACGGARLNPDALSVTLGGLTIAQISELPLADLLEFLKTLDLTPHERARCGHLIEDVRRRVATLVEIGLPYLALSRHVRTLSGGEAQRVQLGSAIGNALTGTLYVLDEPTVGLHARDTERLLGVLGRLARAGNAVLVVEHDLDVIRAADHVLDLGPGAGHHGGRLVFEGTPEELRAADTATGEALRDEEDMLPALDSPRVLQAAENVVPYGVPRMLRIVGARAHNLKDLTVEFPLNRLVAVSGVSGSGKSSLVVDVLAVGGMRAFGKGARLGADEIGEHERIEGLQHVDDVVLVDQSPLGRSSRSNPATYTKAWDEIRTLFERTESAKTAGLTKAHFSFNAPGGRCEECEGSGVVSIDMQFLADVTVVCDACDGRRFSEKVLAVRLRGRNVAELLETTVDEARELFADVPALVRKLAPLHQAGLGYLRLGQSTATLSGGEAQRLKIASFLGGSARGHVLFVFDEPTTGLHPSDVGVLLRVLRRLVDAGHSVVAVEHHLGFLARADHLIELGPEGGEAGGHVVFAGTPRALAARGETPTAEALRRQIRALRHPSARVREATIRR